MDQVDIDKNEYEVDVNVRRNKPAIQAVKGLLSYNRPNALKTSPDEIARRPGSALTRFSQSTPYGSQILISRSG